MTAVFLERFVDNGMVRGSLRFTHLVNPPIVSVHHKELSQQRHGHMNWYVRIIEVNFSARHHICVFVC